MAGFKYHVFLSHRTSDKPTIEELAIRLRREGIEPWLDMWNLVPGQAWQPAIEQALDDCATCAVAIGGGGFGPWQNEEMRAAIDRRVSAGQGQFRVIPVLLPGVERPERGKLPTFLAATTWVEFRQSLDDAEAFRRLVCGIRGEEPGPGRTMRRSSGRAPTGDWKSSMSSTPLSSSAGRRLPSGSPSRCGLLPTLWRIASLRSWVLQGAASLRWPEPGWPPP